MTALERGETLAGLREVATATPAAVARKRGLNGLTEASAVLDLDGRPRPLQHEKQTAEVTVGADGFTR